MGNALGISMTHLKDKQAMRKQLAPVFTECIRCYRERNKTAIAGTSGPANPVVGLPGISVCTRKRPIRTDELENGNFDVVTAFKSGDQEADPNTRIVVHNSRLEANLTDPFINHHEYDLDQVFCETDDNSRVYHYTAHPLLVYMLQEGGLATIFMFGQTGSGKTYTMVGLYERLCQDIFHSPDFLVSVSMFEIAGHKCRDLLQDAGNDAQLKLLEDGDGEVHVRGAAERSASSPAELIALFKQAAETRATSATAVHDHSSRSHAVYRVFLRKGTDTENPIPFGQFTLIDLAGSEWKKDSAEHDKKRFHEAQEINTSLMVLKNCIRLRRKQLAQAAAANPDNPSSSPHIHIPFREHVLTKLLKQCFTLPSSASKTVIITTVSPCSGDTEHTLSTLHHAGLMGGISAERSTEEDINESAGNVTKEKIDDDTLKRQQEILKAQKRVQQAEMLKKGEKGEETYKPVKRSAPRVNRKQQAIENLSLAGIFATYKGKTGFLLLSQLLTMLADCGVLQEGAPAAPEAQISTPDKGKKTKPRKPLAQCTKEQATTAFQKGILQAATTKDMGDEGKGIDFKGFRESIESILGEEVNEGASRVRTMKRFAAAGKKQAKADEVIQFGGA